MSLFDKPNDGQSIEPYGLDYNEAASFLEILDPPAEGFTFQTFDDDKRRKDRSLARVGHGPLLDNFLELMALNEQGAGVFVTPNATALSGARNNENIVRVRAVFQDDDKGFMGSYPLEPSIVVKSSPGKFQRYWCVEGLSFEEFDGVMERIIADYGGDPDAKGLARVMRLPGYWHRKADPFLVRMVSASGKRYTREEILAAFPSLARPRYSKAMATESDIELDQPTNIEAARQYLAERAPIAVEGSRGDSTTYKVCCVVVRDHALSEGKAIELLATWNQRCRPPWSVAELEEKVRRALAYGRGSIGSKTAQGLFGEVVGMSQAAPLALPAPAATPALHAPGAEAASAATGAVPFVIEDLDNARRFARQHGEDIRHVVERKMWLVWNGARWVKDDEALERRAGKTLDDLLLAVARLGGAEAMRLLKAAVDSRRKSRVRGMIDLARSEEGIAVRAVDLDADLWLLGVQNGVVDLKTGEFRALHREDYITKFASVAFDPAAQCPNWEAFLLMVMHKDRDRVEYLQRFAGYMLTGSVQEEAVLLLFGVGRNGKSTFREVLSKLIGDYALTCSSGLLIERRQSDAASPEVAALKGVRLAAVNETAEDGVLREERLKFIASNEPISARYLNENPIRFLPTHKLAITTNHKPIVKGSDLGIWRRLHPVRFGVTIPDDKVETDFRERRLEPEMPGILNWALAGLAAYLRDGLKEPAAVKAERAAYREEMDLVGPWITERCELAPSYETGSSLLFKDFAEWSVRETGIKLSQTRFGRELEERGFAVHKKGRKIRIGLRLKYAPAAVMVPLSPPAQTHG